MCVCVCVCALPLTHATRNTQMLSAAATFARTASMYHPRGRQEAAAERERAQVGAPSSASPTGSSSSLGSPSALAPKQDQQQAPQAPPQQQQQQQQQAQTQSLSSPVSPLAPSTSPTFASGPPLQKEAAELDFSLGVYVRRHPYVHISHSHTRPPHLCRVHEP